MKYQLGKDIECINNRLDRIEAALLQRDVHQPSSMPSNRVVVLQDAVEEEAMPCNEDASAAGPQFIKLEGRYKSVAHRHTLFSFRVSQHSSAETRIQFQQLVLTKGQELRRDGLGQDFADWPPYDVKDVQISTDQVLCICSFREPNFVNFITVSWFPNTGPGGGGASYVRWSDGTTSRPYPDWVLIPFTSGGTTYAGAHVSDTNHEPSYWLRHEWANP